MFIPDTGNGAALSDAVEAKRHEDSRGVIPAAIGTLTVNFLNTGLVFNVTPAFMVQLYLGVLLMIVIMFQTGSRIFDDYQRRQQILFDVDARKAPLLARKAESLKRQ